MIPPWTEEQNALLKRIWPTGENIKRYMPQLGNRGYTTIVSHAKKTLKLGPRPKSARGKLAYAWPTIEAELKKLPGTAPELIKRTGLAMCAVCTHLRESNPGPQGKVHILAWRRRSTGGKPVAVYALGPGENALMPDPFTTAEKWKRELSRRVGSDPFAAAAGLVKAPTGETGRVFQQPMDIDDWTEAERRAA